MKQRRKRKKKKKKFRAHKKKQSEQIVEPFFTYFPFDGELFSVLSVSVLSVLLQQHWFVSQLYFGRQENHDKMVEEAGDFDRKGLPRKNHAATWQQVGRGCEE